MHESEVGYRSKTRKHVVASRDLPAGTVVRAADVALKRSASPSFIQETAQVVGRRLVRAVKTDEAIRPDMLEQAR
jgi:flagella basal body P-ring formation protein FlgA